MKIYKFDCKDYGEYFLVLANSPEEALISIQAKIATQIWQSRNHREQWAAATVSSLPFDFGIDEFGLGEVIEAEWA